LELLVDQDIDRGHKNNLNSPPQVEKDNGGNHGNFSTPCLTLKKVRHGTISR